MNNKTPEFYKEFLTKYKTLIHAKQTECQQTRLSYTLHDLAPLFWSYFKALYPRDVPRRFMRDHGFGHSDRTFIKYCNGETLNTLRARVALEQYCLDIAEVVLHQLANSVRAQDIIDAYLDAQ